MNLEAIFNAVIVQPIELEETTYGNIVVPDLGNEKNKTGKVVSVGPGMQSVTGEFLKTVLKTGDVVVLPTMGFIFFMPDLGNEKNKTGKVVSVGPGCVS